MQSLFSGPDMMRGGSTVHLNQFSTIPVSSVKRGIKGGHLAAFGRPENSIDAGAVIEKHFTSVNVPVERRNVKRRAPVVSCDVKNRWALFGQPFN